MKTQIWDKNNIAYFLPIVCLAPPCIANMDYKEKRYMVFTGSDGGYFEIDETVTLDMVRSRWIPWEGDHNKEKTSLAKQGIQEWKIPGSKGNKYTVTLRNGEFSCECIGFGFRRKCKHVKQAELTLTNKT